MGESPPPEKLEEHPPPKKFGDPPENLEEHPPENLETPQDQPPPPQDQTPPGPDTPPLWTEWMTDACENITLAKTSFRPVKRKVL